MPAVVWEARTEAESQVLASGAGEINIEPPSPAYNDDFRDAQHVDLPPSPTKEDLPPLPAEQDLLSSSEDEDRPPSPVDDDFLRTRPNEVQNLSPHQNAGRPPAQDTPAVQNDESPPARDPQTLKLDI